MGIAYGFFKCNASKRKVEAELPSLRNAAETPSELELSLTEDLDSIKENNGLKSLIEQAKINGINFVMKGEQPNTKNQIVAGRIGNLLNMAYQSSLYRPGEPFYGQVIYQEADRSYSFLE